MELPGYLSGPEGSLPGRPPRRGGRRRPHPGTSRHRRHARRGRRHPGRRSGRGRSPGAGGPMMALAGPPGHARWYPPETQQRQVNCHLFFAFSCAFVVSCDYERKLCFSPLFRFWLMSFECRGKVRWTS